MIWFELRIEHATTALNSAKIYCLLKFLKVQMISLYNCMCGRYV